MGERFRRAVRYLMLLLKEAAAPAMIIIGMLLCILLCLPKLMPEDPQYYFTMLFFVIWFTCAGNVAAHHKVQPPKGTPEYVAVMKIFGGSGRKDRLFSKAMQAFFEQEIPYALELLLQIKECKCTPLQYSTCCHSIGRCYHMMGCASNASTAFEEAEAGGFVPEINLLFWARSRGHAGDVEGSAVLYRRLLDMNCPGLEVAEVDMGMMYLHNDRPADALACFTHSLEEGKAHCDALGGIAVAKLQLGDAAESKVYYQKAIRAMDAESAAGFREVYEEVLREHPQQTTTPGEE
ncbi:MAG: tetratricopeptide repeat protein [Oscillospiraceae bacterium]|nr:tetratricopeptide repeat protein [Oscillospiraceae bacterium]